MTETLLRVRLHDRPAALERVTALLRRRGFAVTRLSTSQTSDPLIELAIRIDGERTDLQRVYRELMTLYDVADVRASQDDADKTRELLLLRVDENCNAEIPGRSIGPGLSELIGTPREIDAILDDLTRQEAITGYVRSGEIVLPDEADVQTKRKV